MSGLRSRPRLDANAIGPLHRCIAAAAAGDGASDPGPKTLKPAIVSSTAEARVVFPIDRVITRPAPQRRLNQARALVSLSTSEVHARPLPEQAPVHLMKT